MPILQSIEIALSLDLRKLGGLPSAQVLKEGSTDPWGSLEVFRALVESTLLTIILSMVSKILNG